MQEQDQATFLNVIYSYFISRPSELRHDVRDNFEEYISGVTDEKGTSGVSDDRPIQEQAASMMDQLLQMESMMQTVTFKDLTPAPPLASEPPTPSGPTVDLD